jgi:response regulator RpfG family c-di-GMP phosphodiesterase
MSAIEASRPPPSAARPPSLLLVDDEPSVLSALRRLFRTQGYQVLLANSGAEALALLDTQPVDLVVSDMRMPVMDGASLLEAVRVRRPAVVRMLLTGYSDIASTVAAINRGEIHRYIAKPWVDADLLLVVSDALARRDLEQQNARLQALTRIQNDELLQLNQNLEARVAARTAELGQVNAMLEAAYAELNSNFTLALTVFAGLMEMRQDGIAGHSRRVAGLARRMAAQLGLDERAQQEVYLGALLHDIGKIGFPDAMLGKPVSVYTPNEVTRYRRHPLDGEAALMPLARLHGAARIVRQHHERVDGHGYPDALAGEAISLGARIVAVASDYDGLVSGSLAERKYTPEAARLALRGGIATRYDGRAVSALFEVLAQSEADAVPTVEVEVRELQAGMVLAQDLLSPKGAILLVAGHVFDARVIRQLIALVARDDMRVLLTILRSSVRAGVVAPAAALAAKAPAASTTQGLTA